MTNTQKPSSYEERQKAAENIIRVIADIEQIYEKYFDREFGTIDYENFGIEVVDLLRKRKFKKFL